MDKKIIEQFIKSEGYQFIDVFYKNYKPNVKYICKYCNKEILQNWHKFKQGQRCSYCYSSKIKLKKEFVFNFYLENNLEFLEESYINAHYSNKCKCLICNNIIYKRYKDVNQYGNSCEYCFKEKMKTRMKGSKHPNWNPDRDYIKLVKKMRQLCRNMIKNIFQKTNKKKIYDAENTLGYSKYILLEHLKSFSNFKELYETNNLEIDHIHPISKFIEYGILDPKIINHISNLQPLSIKDNRKKSNKFNMEFFHIFMKQFPKYKFDENKNKYIYKK